MSKNKEKKGYDFLQKKHKHLNLNNNYFDFPKICKNLMFCNELEFTAFILLNKNIQRLLGIEEAYFTNKCPDIKAKIIGTGEIIRIEVEYDAINFRRHKHNSSDADLIVSLCRSEYITNVKGIPVWSFYKYNFKKDIYEFCLLNDIRNNDKDIIGEDDLIKDNLGDF